MPIYSLNYANTFLQVIASGSVPSAAWILHKLHTVVSLAVSNLEIDLCVELARRDGYGVEPTEQTLRPIPYMRSPLNYQQLIGNIIFNLNKGPRSLRVLLNATIPLPFCDMMSSVLLSDFDMVGLICTSPAGSLATIKQGNAEIDTTIIVDEELKISRSNQRVLDYTKAFVIAHPQHPLRNAPLHSVVSPTNHRQISPDSRSGQCSNLLWSVSDKVLSAESFSDVLRLVEAGVGWGIVPHCPVEGRLCNGILAVLNKLYELGGIDIKVYCCYDTVLESERSFLRFLESAHQRLRELGCRRLDDVSAWQPSIAETVQRRLGPKVPAYRQRAVPRQSILQQTLTVGGENRFGTELQAQLSIAWIGHCHDLTIGTGRVVEIFRQMADHQRMAVHDARVSDAVEQRVMLIETQGRALAMQWSPCLTHCTTDGQHQRLVTEVDAEHRQASAGPDE